MVPIYQFQEHCLCVSGEKKDLLTLAAYLRNAEGTLGDLRYQIEYAFDVDSVRSSNLEDPKGIYVWRSMTSCAVA